MQSNKAFFHHLQNMKKITFLLFPISKTTTRNSLFPVFLPGYVSFLLFLKCILLLLLLFWSLWVFVAVHGLSLVAEIRSYLLQRVELLIVVASLVAKH